MTGVFRSVRNALSGLIRCFTHAACNAIRASQFSHGADQPQFGQNMTAAGTVAWQFGQALVAATGADWFG